MITVKVNLFALNVANLPLALTKRREKTCGTNGPGSNSWPRQQQVRAKGRGRWELHGSNHIDSHGKGMEGERMPRNLTECVVDSVDDINTDAQ